MTKAQHDPHDLAQWLLSRDGDLANLAGRELERALDRVEKAEASLDSIAKGEPTPMRMTKDTIDPRALVIELLDTAKLYDKSGLDGSFGADMCRNAADALTDALDRVEKAEAVDDSIMAYLVGHKKGWNEAIEAAALVVEKEGKRSLAFTDEAIANTYCQDAAMLVRLLKKGASQ